MNTPPYTILYEHQPGEAYALDDCDCACPQALPAITPPVLSAQALLRAHPQLRRIDLGDGAFGVFVPSRSRVAVVDEAGLALLDRLAAPQLLAELDAAAADAARTFVALGLAHQVGQPEAPPAEPDELVAWLHVTNACNLRCTYCYITKSDEQMSAETAFAAVDAIMRAAQQHGYQQVLLKYAGGEASLNLPLVEQMQHYAQQQADAIGVALRGAVLSNGVGLTRHKLQRIQSLGLRLMISLDGLAESHDAQRPTIHGQPTFRAVTRSVELAREMGLDLIVSITVTGASANGLPDIVAWALDRDVRFSLNFYRENDCSSTLSSLQFDQERLIAGMRAAYAVIEQRLPRYSLLGVLIDRANLAVGHSRTCAVGNNYMVVDHHGGVSKCQMEIDRPVTTVWSPDPLTAIRLDPVGVQNLPVDQKQGCRDCDWRYWCTGGCPIATFRAMGRFDVRSPNCGIYTALYPDVVRLEALRLRAYAAPSALA